MGNHGPTRQARDRALVSALDVVSCAPFGLYLYAGCQSSITGTDWQLGFCSDSYPFITPIYSRAYMNWLWDTYHPNAIMVTEFGFPVSLERNLTLAMQRNDLPRSLYYESYLTDMLNVIHEDGVNIIGAIGPLPRLCWIIGNAGALNHTSGHRTKLRRKGHTSGHFLTTSNYFMPIVARLYGLPCTWCLGFSQDATHT